MSLVLSNDTYKIYVRKGVVRVRSSRGDEVVVGSSIERIVIATSRVSITAKAIRQLALLGVDVVVLAPNGEPVARIYPPVINRTVMTRRCQYEASLNGKGFVVAKVLVKAKIINQANLLRYIAKSGRLDWVRDEAVRLDELAMRVADAKDSSGVMELEAQAARHYWQVFAQLLRDEYGFTGRRQEGGDEFNVMLNYGYGLLRYVVEKSLLIHGFDPYAGFLHADKSGKPSLTLDVMEPFRPIVDKALFFARPHVSIVNGYLDYQSRGSVIKIVLEALNGRVYMGSRAVTGLGAINSFVENMACYLRGDCDLVLPIIRW